jgi:hypothetical protein
VWGSEPFTPRNISHGWLIEYQQVSSDLGGCAPLGNPSLVALAEFWTLILTNDQRPSPKENFLKHIFCATRNVTVDAMFGRPHSRLHHLLVLSSQVTLEVCFIIIIIIISCIFLRKHQKQIKQTPWSESASELYRQSDGRFSAK